LADRSSGYCFQQQSLCTGRGEGEDELKWRGDKREREGGKFFDAGTEGQKGKEKEGKGGRGARRVCVCVCVSRSVCVYYYYHHHH